MPSGFKMNSATLKYNGLEEPEAWLEDYLTTVKFQRRTKVTAMQYLQLMLEGSARHWLKNLRHGSISSWTQFRASFIENFKSTYKRPASLEELSACKQGTREALRAYIQRWTILKNSAEDISDESAIDAFRRGLQRVEFKEQLGQMIVRTLARLLELANSWVDGEESVCNEQKPTLHDQNTTTTTTEIEETTEEGSDPDRTSTTKEDLTWSLPVSQTTGTAGTMMIADHNVETTQKTSPRLRGENRGQGSHATALAHSALPKNYSMDRALYTDSETCEESSNHPTPSGIVEASTSWPRRKAAPRS